MDLHHICAAQMSANLVQSRSKCGANGVNATFALDLHGGGKSWCKCGIYPICTTFSTALDQICSYFYFYFLFYFYFRQKDTGKNEKTVGDKEKTIDCL